jgi:hypothetical protein
MRDCFHGGLYSSLTPDDRVLALHKEVQALARKNVSYEAGFEDLLVQLGLMTSDQRNTVRKTDPCCDVDMRPICDRCAI